MTAPRLLVLALACCALLAACAYPVRNLQAERRNSFPGVELVPDRDTLVIVTASGGGTRATALAASVLEGLAQVQMPSGETMADSVGVISSVSGGSVTAAWFALKGKEGLHDLETNFIRQDGMAAILTAGLNPVGLARLSTPGVERIDLLIDYLNRKSLFNGLTFGDLPHDGRHPFLILNAGDMVAGTPFSLTPYMFDLLCSDWRSFPLATGVAASAAFPVALSPVTLTNYSPCPAQGGTVPAWVTQATSSSWEGNEFRVMRGRAALAYAQGTAGDPNDPQTPPKKYIHLLDGGITDNMGVTEPIRLITTQDVAPSLFNRISQGGIKRIVWVMINARSAPPSGLDTSIATPGIIDMLTGTTGAAIDSKSASSIRDVMDTLSDLKNAGTGLPPELARNFAALQTSLVRIDFDAIADIACRRQFHSIPTSWTLSAHDVDAVMMMGGALLAADPEFQAAQKGIGARWTATPATLAGACAKMAAP